MASPSATVGGNVLVANRTDRCAWCQTDWDHPPADAVAVLLERPETPAVCGDNHTDLAGTVLCCQPACAARLRSRIVADGTCVLTEPEMAVRDWDEDGDENNDDSVYAAVHTCVPSPKSWLQSLPFPSADAPNTHVAKAVLWARVLL
jgi:hypothetical protein